jgi:hypothetical protein
MLATTPQIIICPNLRARAVQECRCPSWALRVADRERTIFAALGRHGPLKRLQVAYRHFGLADRLCFQYQQSPLSGVPVC